MSRAVSKIDMKTSVVELGVRNVSQQASDCQVELQTARSQEVSKVSLCSTR
jgi:hypothetical protein